MSARADRGRRLPGPSALGDDLGRFGRLTWTLAANQFKLRFYGSALGYLWQLMRPLLLFGVLFLVFSVAIDLGDDVRHYPVMLLAGIVLFTFLADASGGAVSSVVERESLVRKVAFPRMVIPASVVLNACFNLALNLVVLLVFAAASGVKLRSSVVQVPILLAALVLLSFGLALGLSALYVRYRDVRPIWDVGLQIVFYASPVLYPIELVLERNETIAQVMMLNPFAALIQQARHAAIDPSTPSAASVAGGPEILALTGLVLAAVLAAGAGVFLRRAPGLAEEL